MIKINLLPRKRQAVRASDGGQLWLAVVFALLLAEVAGFFVFHELKNQELKDQTRKNAELQAQIDQSKKVVSDHEQIKAELTQLREREDAIAKLQSARTGPTAALLEVSKILTPGRGPSVAPDKLSLLRRENPLAVHNSGWDSRRLWLTTYVEDQRKVKLEGMARDGEDVSEFARRLNLSDYFHGVKLLPAKKVKEKDTDIEMVSFQLEAMVRY